MNTKNPSFAYAIAIALLAVCSSSCGSTRARSDAGPISSLDGGTLPPTDAGDVIDAFRDAPTAIDATIADYVTVTFNGEPVAATLLDCGDVDGATYRSLLANAQLDNGYTLTINFIYAFAGAGGHAPLGSTNIGRDGERFLAVQLMMSGDEIPWQASGTLHLVAAGEAGVYEGSAEGTFTLNNPFLPTPPDPIQFTFDWRHRATP